MLDDTIGGIDRSAGFKYGLKDPFAKANINFKEKFENDRNIENEIEKILEIFREPLLKNELKSIGYNY